MTLWTTLIKRDFEFLYVDCDEGCFMILYRELLDTYCVDRKEQAKWRLNAKLNIIKTF